MKARTVYCTENTVSIILERVRPRPGTGVQVLVLSEKSGAKLLLSLERPQALLEALQRVADRRAAR